MLKVTINKDDPNGLEKALRKFKKICFEVEQEARKHEYYLRPGLKKIQKSKNAQQRKMLELKKLRGKKYGRNQKNDKRTTNSN